ncbi:MAG: DUF3365 domain-containing protein [Ignavibacterium sp.]|nr:DUF3365 domain-containing protein [Ignavibacterium sp.]MCX7611611.1 DUF3365 domain-containing protein [Ignavibacterium sp.]MDW8375161.1 DUF3365 domain-containing protein [Ignavibacteriales bacterium]
MILIKKILFIFIFSLLITSACDTKDKQQVSEEIKAELRTNAKNFLDTLKSILISKIQEDGIVGAVAVCSDTAQSFTKEYGENKGLIVKRVSLKNRNPNNYPDSYEENVLKSFQHLVESNPNSKNFEHFELVNRNSHRVVRYLKPIFIQAECLNCHGSREQMIKEVQEIIKSRYPDDRAINYKIGDLRGAISIQKEIK